MNTHYYIQLMMQTDRGLEPYGRFDLGSERAQAMVLWEELDGNPDAMDAPLQMEWVEAAHALPMNILIKGCTLSQLASNCAYITKEIFKINNLFPKKRLED